MKHLLFAGLALVLTSCSHQENIQHSDFSKAFTAIAVGDAGETGSALRSTAKYINEMYTEQHDGGKPDAMIFLGDNFYPLGLNVPVDDVTGKIKSVLGPYRQTFEGIGRTNVHAVAGNHDYYARNALEKSLFFGLIDIAVGPVGLSEKGNERERAIEWWTYYYKMPAEVMYPVSAGSKDSVQFIFYDSALPLRTDPATWRPALDSLRRLLTNSAARPGIVWRIFAQHHPWYSVGEHGGYSVWDDEAKTVNYLPNCDRDSNVIEWFVNTLDPQDLCASKYQAQIDSLKAVMHSGGAKIHLMLAGHEHNLQLLSYPERNADCSECPKVYVISGAGSKPNRVKLPFPPHEFTASQPGKSGESLSGFAQLKFENGKLRVVFFNSANGEKIDMGEGKNEFWIDRNGELLH